MLGSPSVTSTPETREMAANLQGQVFMYNAALWCGPCTRDMVARALTRDWEYVEETDDGPAHFWNPNTDTAFDHDGSLIEINQMDGTVQIVGTDTDTFPSNVDHLNSESDTPEHCDACGTFLENDLTQDGKEYTHAAINKARRDGRNNSPSLTVWEPFYHLEEAHKWGPVEEARFTGNPHKKCQFCHCITLDLED